MKGTIRRADRADLPAIRAIYDSARNFMRRSGNLTQWINGYPGDKELLADLSEGNLYVGTDSAGEILFVFAFILGDDPTYYHIKGRWFNDEPYGTVHRIASAGKGGGVLEQCVAYCFGHTGNLRIDTHKDNQPMLRALSRCGFIHCGEIICTDGTPREAFQLSASQ